MRPKAQGAGSNASRERLKGSPPQWSPKRPRRPASTCRRVDGLGHTSFSEILAGAFSRFPLPPAMAFASRFRHWGQPAPPAARPPLGGCDRRVLHA